MAGVNFTFNLGPVSGTGASSTTGQGADAATEASVGTQFQSVQKSVQNVGGSGHSVVSSPACDGGDCFIVHGDGPGVTTLSIGEEDGGADGYVSRPVIDGVEFLEPPITSFAGAAEYDISTLAIGEEDGGFATSSPEIGGIDSASAPVDGGVMTFVEETTIQPYASDDLVFTDGIETARISPDFGKMDPIYSPGDAQFAAQPTYTSIEQIAAEPVYSLEDAQFATETINPIDELAQVQFPPVEGAPAASSSATGSTSGDFAYLPQSKPVSTGATGFPLPDAKPNLISASVVTYAPAEPLASSAFDTPLPGMKPGLAGTAEMSSSIAQQAGASNTISVGDYDSYIASLGDWPLAESEPSNAELESGAAGASEDPGQSAVEPVTLETGGPLPASTTTIIETPRSLAPDAPLVIDLGTAGSAAPADGNSIGSGTSIQPIQSADPISLTPQTGAPEPVYIINETSPASTAPSPETLMQPSSVMPGPASLSQPTFESGMSTPDSMIAPELTRGTTFTSPEAPVPLEKPASASADAPQLSDDDFRITTLALGEEDAGGG